MDQSADFPLYPEALSHGKIEQVFSDVFFVSGAMETVLLDMDWQFSRNMTIVRDGDRLVLINSIRLDDEGLAELERLGRVTDVIRLGSLHGRDDAFYVDRYQAHYWVMPGMQSDNIPNTHVLTAEPPITDASMFRFETTAIPEGIIRLDRDGGILIACDALQNWLAPDEHFCDTSCRRMQEMGFFTPANIGPVWMQAAAPAKDDFDRLLTLDFKHALCGHGSPLREDAKTRYSARFQTLFAH